MKYRISWTNTSTGEKKHVTVHSMHAVQEVKDTLSRQPWRHENIAITEISRVRMRDIIIAIEN